jgi:predicted aspartyl protease
MDRHLIIIQGKLQGGVTLDFIFDTGTTGIILSEDIAKKYRLKPKGFSIMSSINGETQEKLKNFAVSSLSFNGVILKNTRAVAVKSENIFSPTAAGIVGLSAFSGNLVTIDYKNSKLIFKKGTLPPGENTIPLSASNILEANIELNGQKVLAHFDNGAPGFIAIPKEWSTYKVKTEPVLRGRGRTPMGEFEVYTADFDGAVTIGKLVLKDPKITLLTGRFPAVNLGFQFFKEYKITIDSKSKLMQIVPYS